MAARMVANIVVVARDWWFNGSRDFFNDDRDCLLILLIQNRMIMMTGIGRHPKIGCMFTGARNSDSTMFTDDRDWSFIARALGF